MGLFMTTRSTARTTIFQTDDYGSTEVGYLDKAGKIFRSHAGDAPVGYVNEADRVFRFTAHDERELGRVDATGAVYSHGLFEGGALGWLEADGVVMQGGLILGEEEVGRVEGPRSRAAAAALLLLFLPDQAEANRRAQR
jgi:hypothetical protein